MLLGTDPNDIFWKVYFNKKLRFFSYSFWSKCIDCYLRWRH